MTSNYAMQRSACAIAATTLFVLGNTPVHGATPTEQRLVVAETADSYELSVPVSRLVMTLPRGQFSVVTLPGTDANADPRYFHFQDATRGIVISGWFEPSTLYEGMEPLWKSETDAWKKHGLPKPRDVSFSKLDKWDVVVYDNKLPGGNNTHIRSEWSELGTWIDVHISVTTTEPIDVARATAMEVLRSLRISEAK